MDAFSRAFEAMRARPWHALGLAAIIAAGTVVLGALVALLAAFLFAAVAGQLVQQIGCSTSAFGSLGAGCGSLLDALGGALGQVLLIILLVLLVLGVGTIYLLGGLTGSAATALSGGGVRVDLSEYFRLANRHFARLLLLSVIFGLGLLLYGIVVIAIAWVARDTGVLVGLWLFVAFLGVVLLGIPAFSLGTAAVVLDDASGGEAFSAALRTMRRHPADVAGMTIILAVLAVVLSILTSQLSRPLETAGSLLGVYAGWVLGLFSQLVWLFYHRSVTQPASLSPLAGPLPGWTRPRPQQAGTAVRAGSSGRLGVLERGIARPDVRVRAGDVLVVGRDPRADIRLEDPQVSRRQATITTEGGVWVVCDLGATNPTRLLDRDGSVREVRGGPARVPYGQVSVGESLLTLYPIEA